MTHSVIHDKRLIARIRELSRRTRDAKPAFKRIAARMLAATHRNFQSQRTPDGRPWVALSERTLKRRGGSGRILMDTGDLRQRCESSYTGREATVTNTIKYARTHQRGDRKRKIPARPFLGLTGKGNRQYKNILTGYLRHV